MGKRSRSQSNGRNINKRRRRVSSYEHAIAAPKTMDTVYRILCPGKKIGGVIGKGGTIINALRDETHAKIRVADSIPGVDERVIIIFSSSTKKAKSSSLDQDLDKDAAMKEDEIMEPHCAAQDALLRVHERIIADEDQDGSAMHEHDPLESAVVARLLVPSVQVGCLLGKGGNIIQKLRSDTNANIRVLPPDFLPHGSASSDELVQISGSLGVVRKALYEVSTLLHQNPRKEAPNSAPVGTHRFNSLLPDQGPLPPGQWFGGYRGKGPGFVQDGFSGGPPGSEAPEDFSLKVLCSCEKIGGVIGKGGSNVKQVEQETGARILVEDVEADENERVIVVSSVEALRDRLSPTIEAILQLQSKISAVSEKGTITTRLLVPSSKVGCLLGEGGHVITDMRRRTQADIRVYSKSDKPKCASPNEELVQISGNVGIAREALMEILSRLRERILRGTSGAVKPSYVGSFPDFPPPNNVPARGPPSTMMLKPRAPGGYDHLKGPGHEDYGYASQSSWTRYPGMSNPMEAMVPNSSIPSVAGASGGHIAGINQVPGATVKLQDPASGSSECVVQIHGSLGHVKAEGFLQSFAPPVGAPLPLPPEELVYHDGLNAAV